MTPAAAIFAAACFVLIGVATWLKRTEDAHARFVDNTHEETP
jgi:hypothetical protein